MAANDGNEYGEKAKECLDRMAGSSDGAVVATVGVGYAVLALLDEIRAQRAAQAPKGGVGAGFKVNT